MINSIFTEYGLLWAVNRSLYSTKIKMLEMIPATEKIFEKKVDIKRIDIFNLDVGRIKEFLQSLTKDKQIAIMSLADKACKGIITGFSSIELDYGNPINWHYNPLTKVESNREVKWYHIPDFDADRGDIKVIWEASRFTHFFYFSRAYLLTGDKKYYQVFSEQIEQWLQDNPYPYGANYKCGQECTLRMVNALMAYSVFKYYGIVTVNDEQNIRKIVEVCYSKVLANFFYAHKCIKNNHTLSEICGLIIGAWCCNDHKRLDKAYQLLNKEIDKQFLPDGGYIQYSFNYQRFALQIMECIIKLSERTEKVIPDSIKSRIKASVIFMYQMQDECGDMPNYGSNDGALIFPISVCGYRDFRPVLNSVYALVEAKRLYEQGDYDEELLWFSTQNVIDNSVAGISKEPSSFFNSGLYTLRHDGGFLMVVLPDYKTRPSQMDGLHIDLWHKNVNVLCDSGTYSYATESGQAMALTAAHNTVKFNGKEQMKKRNAFMVYDWTGVGNVKCTQNCFTGTMVSKNGYEHTRTINQTPWGYVVIDEVKGEGEYCEFNFHTPCEVRLIKGGFQLLVNDSSICTIIVNESDIFIKKAYVSIYYLIKQEISCVSLKCRMSQKRCIIKFDMELH